MTIGLSICHNATTRGRGRLMLNEVVSRYMNDNFLLSPAAWTKTTEQVMEAAVTPFMILFLH